MSRDIVRQWVVALSVVAVVVVNILANALPLNGQTTGEISDRFQVLFVPAGYVFAIWGVIYIGLIAYAVYQFLPSQRNNPRLASIAWLFVVSSAANIIWLFLWHYNVFFLTVVAMGALLISLIAIYLRLDIGRVNVPTAETWLVRVPFSIYLGWITVATIANITDVLWLTGWNGQPLTPEIWTVLLLVIGAAIAAAVTLTRGDIVYPWVIVWAFVGIAVKQAAVPLVATAAYIMVGVVALVTIIAAIYFVRNEDPFKPAG